MAVVLMRAAHAFVHIFNFPIDENEKENENILFSRWCVRLPRCHGLIFVFLSSSFILCVWNSVSKVSTMVRAHVRVYRHPFYMRIKSPCCPVKIIYKLFMPTSPSPSSLPPLPPPPTAPTLLAYGWRASNIKLRCKRKICMDARVWLVPRAKTFASREGKKEKTNDRRRPRWMADPVGGVWTEKQWAENGATCWHTYMWYAHTTNNTNDIKRLSLETAFILDKNE